jgi:hypothetical protein
VDVLEDDMIAMLLSGNKDEDDWNNIQMWKGKLTKKTISNSN